MPLSNDNQDYGASDTKNAQQQNSNNSNNNENNLSTDDLKGKKVDADPDKESDKPAKDDS